MGFNWKRAAGLPPMDAAYGVIPSRNRIRGLENYTLIEPCGIHENPRFYKYRWRIWALDNTDEDWKPERDDRAVLRHGFNRRAQPVLSLSFHDGICRMQSLVERGEFFYALMNRLKRADPAAPWLPASCRAPSYDADPDTPFHGHK